MKIKLYFLLSLCFIKAIILLLLITAVTELAVLVNVSDDKSMKEQCPTSAGTQTVLSLDAALTDKAV